MTQTEIEQLIIELVRKIQALSGRPETEIDRTTCPLLDLDDFDSLNGVELTVEVSDRLKFEPEFNNVLASEDRALSIAEAAQRLLQHTHDTVSTE